MEFLEGQKLVDGVRAMSQKWAAKMGTNVETMEREMMARFEAEGLPPVYSGPSAFQIDIYRRFLMTSDAIVNAAVYAYNFILQAFDLVTLGGINTAAWRATYHESFIPLNTSRIMDTLLRAHGKQVSSSQ
jgi:hypothetical protein